MRLLTKKHAVESSAHWKRSDSVLVIACVFVLLLFLRSCFARDDIEIKYYISIVLVGSHFGVATLEVWLNCPVPKQAFSTYSSSEDIDWRHLTSNWGAGVLEVLNKTYDINFGGFRFARIPQKSGSTALSTTYWFQAPYWFICASLAYIPLIKFLQIRRSKKLPSGLCDKCGYDLRASSGKCPECGEPILQTMGFKISILDWKAEIGLDGSGSAGFRSNRLEHACFPPGTFDFGAVASQLKSKLSPVKPNFTYDLFTVTFWKKGAVEEIFYTKDAHPIAEIFEVFKRACKEDEKGMSFPAFEEAWRKHPPTLANIAWDDS